jgi:Uma2 family endonuclease
MSATITTRKFTVEEFIRLDQMRFFQPDEKLELLDGEIHPMSPIGPRHGGLVNHLNRWLHGHLAEEWLVLCQNPVALTRRDLPQPDFAIVPFRGDHYSGAHPVASQIRLIIEVADTSTDIDLGRKLELYAQAGIPEYWVFNLAAEILEVFTQPQGGSYQAHQRLSAPDTARSEALGIALPLADFLKQG